MHSISCARLLQYCTCCLLIRTERLNIFLLLPPPPPLLLLLPYYYSHYNAECCAVQDVFLCMPRGYILTNNQEKLNCFLFSDFSKHVQLQVQEHRASLGWYLRNNTGRYLKVLGVALVREVLVSNLFCL